MTMSRNEEVMVEIRVKDYYRDEIDELLQVGENAGILVPKRLT
jgi:hypothetical protein